jgi:hypothetical protein
MAPATYSRTFRQVGRMNSLGKPASRDSRLSGRGDSRDGGVGSGCCIPWVESTPAESRQALFQVRGTRYRLPLARPAAQERADWPP